MTNRDLAEKVYEDLNKRGADLGNASIGIIRKTLDDNGVKNCSIPDVVGRSEQLVCDVNDKKTICKNPLSHECCNKHHKRL